MYVLQERSRRVLRWEQSPDSREDTSHTSTSELSWDTHRASHGITEWFGLDGALQVTQFQPPCHGQGHLPPDQVAPSPIQPGLEPCQGGGSHSFSEQPGPGPHHSQREEYLPRISYKPTLCQCKAITPCPFRLQHVAL